MLSKHLTNRAVSPVLVSIATAGYILVYFLLSCCCAKIPTPKGERAHLVHNSELDSVILGESR